MFHIFASQEERRAYGGSAFVEIQFCRLPHGTSVQELVAVDSIRNWQNDSLYTDDENRFYEEYHELLDFGIYNNMKRGTVDIYGINYYPPSAIDTVINRLIEHKPAGYAVFLEWLNRAKLHNGFYVLGI